MMILSATDLQRVQDDVDSCRRLVASDMERVDQLIHSRLSSDVVLINQMSGYIVGNGGKRLRPQLVLLAAGACRYSGDQHIVMAAIIEFIHTATLLHDDVVDASELRRGKDTANSVWGNEAAVLVGDFLYSRAFEMMVDVQSLRVMEILASTTNRIAEGEVMQLLNVNEPGVTVERYLEVVRAKTARLFEAAAQLAGVLASVDRKTEENLAAYGRHLGTAFQIADDVLDYTGDAGALGKNIGDDLAEGKPTLPLILAMQNGNESEREVVAAAIRDGGVERLNEVMQAVSTTGALPQSMAVARREAELAQQAIAGLPVGEYSRALAVLADYSVSRIQ